ncbi:MAG: sulfite exporter TauE/SafE family protein [Planctomycetaceae bacterium]|nr:sulfite exporter TauE/SafE family protein [Planctomycetaceae bacterium]
MDDWDLVSIVFASAVGGGVGLLSGLFGVGGGFLLVPVLNAVLGVPMPIAVGSTACYTLGPATVAVLSRKPSSGFLELPLILAGGLLVGVWVGAKTISSLGEQMRITVFSRHVAAVDLAVLSCYALLMLGIAWLSLRPVRPAVSDNIHRRGLLSAITLRPMAHIPDLRPATYSIPLLAWLGLSVGALSGFLGMSGGLILVPAAIYLLGLRAHDAATVTIGIVWLVSFQSTLMHAYLGNVQRSLVVSLLVCGTIGAGIGSGLGTKMTGHQLRRGFGLLVLVSAGVVIAKLGLLLISADTA